MKTFLFFSLPLCFLEARELWPGDIAFDGLHHRLTRRRFSQESLSNITKLNQLKDCPEKSCKFSSFVLPQQLNKSVPFSAGGGIAPLLALKPPCDQQDHADAIIDAAKDMSNGIGSQESRKQMIQIAIEYRQAEKNTKPIYWPQVTGRNSVYCLKAPKNSELDGLVQAQDPANDHLLFFDPAVKTNDSTVILGKAPKGAISSVKLSSAGAGTGDGKAVPGVNNEQSSLENVNLKPVTAFNHAQVGVNDTAGMKNSSPNPQPSSAPTQPTPDMRLEFGSGFEGREAKDLAYQPLDSAMHTHTAALIFPTLICFNPVALDMCNELLNICGLKQGDPRFDQCKTLSSGIGKALRDGGAADRWNAAFGFTTTYAKNMATGHGTGGMGEVPIGSGPDIKDTSLSKSDSEEEEDCEEELPDTDDEYSGKSKDQKNSENLKGTESNNLTPPVDPKNMTSMNNNPNNNLTPPVDPKNMTSMTNNNPTYQSTPNNGSGMMGNPAGMMNNGNGTTGDWENIQITVSETDKCKDMRLEFGSGFKGREAKDLAYQPLDSAMHTHTAALNIKILTEYMCDELLNNCGLKQGDPRFDQCKAVSSGIGKALRDGGAADKWNARFGYTTTYAKDMATGHGTGGMGDAPIGSGPDSKGTKNS
ncbi:hypothetical protein O181_051892 [Austropuccinia psidii MF-1]|uniref:Uncharacterized protein n=1 Tax=Austropuccinia psidii MF-1 TaxID=1389203 RepID=A0A9Q3E6J5_9BASI|nr:hypothetical protein [Austropuccinia psidii MF-1]